MDNLLNFPLGWSVHQKTSGLLHVVSQEVEEQYTWVEEVFAEANKTLARYSCTSVCYLVSMHFVMVSGNAAYRKI
jgi:hypothetical protein